MDPDPLSRRFAESYASGVGGKGEGLVVIAPTDMHNGSRTNAASFEEFEQLTIALIDAADEVILARFGLREEQEAAMAATGGAFHLAEIAVRADAILAELGEELGFEIGRDGVLEALGLVVHLPPFHAEKLRQHAFDKVMTEGEFAGDFATCGGEANVAIGEDADEAVFLETAEGHGHGGGGNFEPIGEAGGDDGFAFGFGLEDGLEVILFGDSDHWRNYTMGG